MKIGIYLANAAGPQDVVERVRAAADARLDSVHLSQLIGWDALTLVAIGAAAVPDIELGTAVVATYPRHPVALAGQAMTAQAVSSRPLTLGVGPSHQVVIEGVFGHSYDRPVRHIREYLTALRPLLRGEPVEVRGQTLTAVGQLDLPAIQTPSLLLAALGPTMLTVAGELADGTVTVWTGPGTVADHIVPTITKAADAAGRPKPRVVSAVGLCVTSDPDRIRASVAERLGFAGSLPAYRATLEREGLAGVHETVVAGDEATVARAVRRYRDAGATELLVGLLGDAEEQARTLRLAADLRPSMA
ncbi:TIGR03564 family F420-dependent LLM class oxidoreductase [Frankia sp. R82]|uniref:TIGR03564 family F420-dependent LLM class oxidoreductase n=1 Tax=Frankia sp. R82 TaxID=2950553 RepID=UPI00204303D9|nr:TIGR03564 family F420-dependent LLM class oxidoreductase [Frankia sp. R82]MCM3882870.1 TIGR03564 family F420-dependent LLM class oxidoreductase [Frankia sp. R82]